MLYIEKSEKSFGPLEILYKYASSTGMTCSCPLLYDIETTGFSSKTGFVYLAGLLAPENGGTVLYQYFAEGEEDEPQLLSAVAEHIKKADLTVQYNGNTFDEPFLKARYEKYGLAVPFRGQPSLDIYRILKSLSGFLAYQGLKQPEAEQFFGLPGRFYPPGGDCTKLYRAFQKGRTPETRAVLLGHNREDLLGLKELCAALAYPLLLSGDWDINDAVVSENRLNISLGLA